MANPSAYTQLTQRLRQLAVVQSVEAVLGWDQETGMPEAAVSYRADQLSWLASHAHGLATSSDLPSLLARSRRSASAPQAASLRVIERGLRRQSQLPAPLIARESREVSLAKEAWQRARRKSRFSLFAPHLKALLQIAREKAECWGYSNEPYDALLVGYEPGMSCEALDRCLGALRPELVAIAAEATQRSRARPIALPPGPYPLELQRQLNGEIAASLGFDFTAGRIDTTAHPFCTTLGPRDVRLTTRYDLEDFTSSLFGVLHETGHGLYEQGLSESEFGLPAGSACSLGIHESQSRLWENHVGRSQPFWEKWWPRAVSLFPQLRRMGLKNFMRWLHRAEFSLIRVESDEATYDLHILLRVELERSMLRGEVEVADIPRAWNRLSQALIGLKPATAAEGCLQDIHWSMGGLGYFATYTLGNLNAAQLFEAAMRDPGVKRGFERAEYHSLLGWLRNRVHRHGALLDPADLIAKASSAALHPGPYLRHLRQRYTKAG